VSDPFKTFDDLEKLFTMLKGHGVTKFQLGDLLVEIEAPAQVLDLAAHDKELEKDNPPTPKTAYEQALERVAGSE
jgi:hypothetical protein